MKITWTHGSWGWGHMVYCPNGCIVCVLPVAVKSKGYNPRPLSKKDAGIAAEYVREHTCETKRET